ncbi:MAG: dipicolinate synthase subunit DpsA [[Clostridium] leptum]
MVDINSFAVLGGDKRQAALAESIAADGYTVYAWGLTAWTYPNLCEDRVAEAVSKCVNIVLPLPVTQDGVFSMQNIRMKGSAGRRPCRAHAAQAGVWR